MGDKVVFGKETWDAHPKEIQLNRSPQPGPAGVGINVESVQSFALFLSHRSARAPGISGYGLLVSKLAGQFPAIGLVIVKGRVLAHISGDETSVPADDRVVIDGAIFANLVIAGGQDDLQDLGISGHIHVRRVDIGDAGRCPKRYGGVPGLALGDRCGYGVAVIQLVLRLLLRKGEGLHLSAWQRIRGDDKVSAAGSGDKAGGTIRGGNGAGTGPSLVPDDDSPGVPKKMAVRISLSWASAMEGVPSGIGSGDRLLVDGTKGNSVANGVFTVANLKRMGVVEPAPFVVELTGLQVERIYSSRPEVAGE